MVSSVGFQLSANRRINGFGARRSTRGRGIRSVVGNVLARPALTFIANKVADLISGSGKRKIYRKRTVRGSSFKLSGAGRKPRKSLIRRRTASGYKKHATTRRAPRKTLRKHRLTYRVLC